ncbi:MAG: hypothetical protein IRY95_09695, partial [Clostridia bacterium]|nr:hypothetical protein [Clostridia bacterium]
FRPQLLMDAFLACIDYFRHVSRHPGATYSLVNWNYMPAAAASQIHPHLQVFATDTPGNAHEEELAASRRYADETGRPYWADLVETEERLGDRFVARGRHTAWLTSFVSQGPLSDVLVLFPERRTMTALPEEAVREFVEGLVQVFRHLASRGVYSFSLAWFPGTEDRDDFWVHVRLSPRMYMAPQVWGTDSGTLQHLYREPFMIWTPEEVAEGLRGAVRL